MREINDYGNTDRTKSQALSLTKLVKRALGAVAIATVAIAAPFSAANAESLRVYVPSDPASVDPAFYGTTTDVYLMNNLLPRLVTIAPGKEWRLHNDVAESIDMSDPANIKFTLKQGLQWANGYGEFTSEDVKFSYERHKDEKVGSYIKGEFDVLDNVEITGKYSGIIHLKYASVPFWQQVVGWTGGGILSKKELMENDGKLPLPPKATLNAYTFAEFSPGERMVLKADPNWRGDKPDFDEIILIPIADTNAAEIAFAAGEIDFMTAVNSSPEQLHKQHGDKATIEVLPTIDFGWLGLNAQHPNLSDIRVRKAIQLAIDVESILAVTYEGMDIKQATGLAAPGMVGYRPARGYKYDPEAARALIKEAGAEGLTIELSHANYGMRQTQGQIIQANLNDIGLNIEINSMDEATFWDVTAIKTKDRQLTLKGWFGNPEVMYSLSTFTKDGFEGWNWEGYDDPKYTELMEEAYLIADNEKRGDIYIKMQDMLEESGTFMYIDNGPATIMYNSDIIPDGFPDGRPLFYAFKKK